MTDAQAANLIFLSLFVILALAAFFLSRQGGPSNGRKAKVPVRSESWRGKIFLPEDDLPLVEQLDRIVVWVLILLGITLVARFLTA